MNVLHFFTVLFLVSNITLAASGLSWLDEVLNILGREMVPYFLETFISMLNGFFDTDHLSFDSKRLRADLKGSLFGQHIASDVVLKTVSSFMTDSNPNKPLVFSFHGTTGTGKSHVTKIIARNLYKKGEQSKHIHLFISDLHFPDKRNLDTYTAQLKQWIHGNVSNFPRSMFIFDEMDRMHPRLIDTLKPFLDNNDNVDGVNLTETLAMVDYCCGFSHSSLINKHLIDHYVPFLPLELKHVRQCVMAEMVHLNMTQDSDLADEVARDMPYYPEEERIYAFKGCKSVRQKLPLYK
ncbi:torsin-1A-like [Sinocyclocheilus grahami]|uniref:torsin-1A-like n=1 Tax=Sinocyclocheilus grahami TaxID=75366 RepID=UPI0007AC9F69|nr:PREDICTED: torsin-1A-like [Sinocyclocheilus grahami]